MLFNSLTFLFLFLPVSLSVFYSLCHFGQKQLAKLFLVAGSFIFYGWATHWFVLVLAGSTLASYVAGEKLLDAKMQPSTKRIVFGLGLLATLGNLFVWKYTAFIFENVSYLFGQNFEGFKLLLPLGISFYTFQQVTYLVDAFAGRAKSGTLLDYFFYITFFPQLVAGPIVLHQELLPQVHRSSFGRLRLQNLIVGLVVFTIGLSKKVLIADNLAPFSDQVFVNAEFGEVATAAVAWRAALSFYAQLYFDFSGYSDMAMGLGRMFGLRFPVNFHSPLKASSVLDFWRRWHITLTRLTTAYLFNPISLKLTRRYALRRLSSFGSTLLIVGPACLVTFVLIGLWHKPSATFIAFGLLHTLLAMIQYSFRLKPLSSIWRLVPSQLHLVLCRALTFLPLLMSFVLFKTSTLFGFQNMVAGLMASTGYGSVSEFAPSYAFAGLLVVTYAIIYLLPNTQQLMARYRVGSHTYADLAAEPVQRICINDLLLVVVGISLAFCLVFIYSGNVVFIYFDF